MKWPTIDAVWLLFLILMVVGVPALLLLYYVWPFQAARSVSTLCQSSSAEGQEYRLVQVWSGTVDLYETQFWYSSGEEQWGYFVLDADAHRWRNCSITVDEETCIVNVEHGDTTVAEFNWRDEELTLAGSGLCLEEPYGWYQEAEPVQGHLIADYAY